MTELMRRKRYQVLTIAVALLFTLGLMWLFVIRPLQNKLQLQTLAIPQVREKIKVAKHNAQLADQMKEDLDQAQQRIQEWEENLPQGDMYRWMINRLLGFQEVHAIEFADFTPPQALEFNPRLKLAYPATSFTVTGSATYHAFGRFLADFENTFPLARLRRLELEPGNAGDPSNTDVSLLFRMEFVTLVKSASQ